MVRCAPLRDPIPSRAIVFRSTSGIASRWNERGVYVQSTVTDHAVGFLPQNTVKECVRNRLAPYTCRSRPLPSVRQPRHHSTDSQCRDTQPDNVLVGRDGRPRVVDFGLAQVGLLDSSPPGELPAIPEGVPKPGQVVLGGRFTLSGVVAGTPGYMSPEQCRGGQIDPRSDQWSFCSALFEALYGFLPFEGKTLPEVTESVFGPLRKPPSQTSVPDDVYRILRRGLSVEPSQRYANMNELLDALALEQGEDVASGQITRRRLSWPLIGVGIVAFVTAQIRLWERPLLHREGIALSVVMLMAMLIGGFLQRRVLREQIFHRSMFVLILISISQNFLQRVVSALIGTPLWKMVPFEMIVLSGNLTICTALLLRRTRWVGLIPLSYAFLSLVPGVPYRLSSIVYLASLIIVFYVWRSAANVTSRREPHSAGSLSAALGVRTPRTGRSSHRTWSSHPSSGPGKSSPDVSSSNPPSP